MKTQLLLLAITLISTVTAGPLDDYINKEEPKYSKTILEDQTFKAQSGATVYVLNVTSQEWLETSKAIGPQGSVWSHLVYVVVPVKFTYKSVASSYLGYGSNEEPNKVMSNTDSLIQSLDKIAYHSEAIAVGITQIPNCPIQFSSDPQHWMRSEDDLVAWTWEMYMKDPNPEYLIHFPMVKSAFQGMRAVEEALVEKGMEKPDGWVVTGASKRGWTAFDTGAVQCDKCVKILGIVPIVPIIPDIDSEVHRMWKAYNGFTWAFASYFQVKLTENIDTDRWKQADSYFDPIHFIDRYKDIPIYVHVAADDEFMMFDWTNMWYDKFTNVEKHLMILPNEVHGIATKSDIIYANMANLVRSIATKQPARGNLPFTYSPDDGSITINLDPYIQPLQVSLQYAQTVQTVRRDFRWQVLNPNPGENCKAPYVPTDEPQQLCGQNIVWKNQTLDQSGPGTWVAMPPQPQDGYWMGYYVTVEFPADTESDDTVSGLKNTFMTSTPGWTWPNTLPFQDCHGDGCVGRPVY